MRKRFWQLHFWLGLLAGLGLLVLGLSGSVLVFHDEVEAGLNRNLLRVEPVAEGRRSFDSLLNGIGQQLPDHVLVGWTIRPPEQATYADLLYVIRRGTSEWQVTTLDPYTGGVLTVPRQGRATVTGWLLELHYSFLADHTGMAIVGVFGLVVLLLGVTGLWIYREFWRHLITLRWRRGARLLFSDLHKFIGVTSVTFNLILGFTGAYWNFNHVIGEWREGEAPAVKVGQTFYARGLSLDALLRQTERQFPGYRVGYISFPTKPGVEVTLYGAVPTRNPLRSPYGSTAGYDAQTGELKSSTDIRTAGLWTQVVDMFVPLHYGTFGGLPVKIIWALGGLTPGVLAVSGFSIWWLRRGRKWTTGTPARPRVAPLTADSTKSG